VPSLGNSVHVAEDPDAAWRAIAPHALHETNAYAAWLSAAGERGPYGEFTDAAALRASGQYQVLTPDELVARLRASGPLTTVSLQPLLAGLDPEIGWETLRLIATKVIPALAASAPRT